MFKISMTKYSPAIGRALLTLACATFLAAPGFAQDPGTSAPPYQQQQVSPQGSGDRQAHQLEHLTKALSLTPDQVTQVKAIQTDTRSQMTALRQDTTSAQSDKHAKMTSIHQAEEAKIKAVLNDDQKAKYDAMQAQMREHRQENQGGNQAPPPSVL